MTSTTYIGIDPGGNTGICTWHLETDQYAGLELPWNPAMVHLAQLVESVAGRIVLVVEVPYLNAESGQKPDVHWAIEGHGVARYLAYLNRRDDVYLRGHPPASAKRFATDDKLFAAGWHHGSPHVRDAARQVLTELFQTPTGDLPVVQRVMSML